MLARSAVRISRSDLSTHHRPLRGGPVPLGGEPPVATVQVEEAPGPAAPRRPEGVLDPRCGHRHDPPPGPGGPPRQVGVLVVREQARVEQTDRIQHPGAQQDRSPAEAVDRDRVGTHAVEQVHGSPVETVVALAALVAGGSQAVDQPGPLEARTQRRCPGPRARPDAVPDAHLDGPRTGQLHLHVQVAGAGGDPDAAGPGVQAVRDVERPRRVRHPLEAVEAQRAGDVRTVDADRDHVCRSIGVDLDIDGNEARFEHQRR